MCTMRSDLVYVEDVATKMTKNKNKKIFDRKAIFRNCVKLLSTVLKTYNLGIAQY